MWEKIKAEAQTYILWAEQTLRDKTGPERRKAVIDLMCKNINLPYVPAFVECLIEPILYGFVVDSVVKVWNLVTGKAFGGLSLTPEILDKTGQIVTAIAKGEAIQVDPAQFAKETADVLGIDAKFDALLVKYGLSAN